eukprot:TRINITY_DN1912_c0_g1_i4.p2 TRINITY_DN1912_c0_g1~~TRINITY_DN1912_c0_g1_i4.p2  ORF type:complete len:165 (-),score=28.17 TRINITY_DN1912_c0_g1_i4:81-575(-)
MVHDRSFPEQGAAAQRPRTEYFEFSDNFNTFLDFVMPSTAKRDGSIKGSMFKLGDFDVRIGMMVCGGRAAKVIMQIIYNVKLCKAMCVSQDNREENINKYFFRPVLEHILPVNLFSRPAVDVINDILAKSLKNSLMDTCPVRGDGIPLNVFEQIIHEIDTFFKD